MEQDRLSIATVVRKLIVGLVGVAVLAAGVVMLVTPGPGIVAILAGLAILSTEFNTAQRLREKLRRRQDDQTVS